MLENEFNPDAKSAIPDAFSGITNLVLINLKLKIFIVKNVRLLSETHNFDENKL